MSFRPSAVGNRSAQIVVANTSDVDPVVQLDGIGATFDVGVTPTEIDMGDVFVGSSRTAIDTIIVDNRSTRTVTIASTAIGGADPQHFAVLGFVTVPIPTGGDYRLDIRFAPVAVGTFTAEVIGTLDNGTTFRVLLRGRGLDTAAPRPRRILGDTIDAAVGERRSLRFRITPPLASSDGVTRLVVRMQLDPSALYPHGVRAPASIAATHEYTPDGAFRIEMTSDEPMALDTFSVELEGLFTGRPVNFVRVDSADLGDPRISVTASPGVVNLEGCDIGRSDSLLRMTRILSVSPNPSGSESVIAYRSSDPATLRLVSASGEIVYASTVDPADEARAAIDLRDLPAGSYLVEITSTRSSDRRTLQITR